MFKLLGKLFGQTKQLELKPVVKFGPPPEKAPMSEDQLKLIASKVNSSPLIRPDQRQRVIDHLTGKSKLFGADDYLVLEEKRELGLNTRQKIHRDLTVVLTEEGLKCGYPAGVVGELGLAASMDAGMMEEILKIGATGVARGVRIVSCDASGDTPCSWSKSMAGKVLPANHKTECDRRTHCDSESYCVGYYEAVLRDL